MLLLAWVGGWLLYYECLLRLRPLPVILAQIQAKKTSLPEAGDVMTAPTCNQLITMDKIYRGATFWMTRIGRSSRPCLRRSLVLHHWCAKQGLSARVVIGAKKDGSDLRGHGWLVVAGRPYHEEPGLLEQYTVFLEG